MHMRTKRIIRNLLILALVAANAGCDRITKNIARQQLEYGMPVEVIDRYVLLTKVENTGAFLGLGHSIPRPLYKLSMIVLPLLAVGWGLYYLIKKKDLPVYLIVGIGFMIGGGLGNIYDRIVYGSVTDFLYFDFVVFHTGIVNTADISITTGFFILLIGTYLNRKKTLHPATGK